MTINGLQDYLSCFDDPNHVVLVIRYPGSGLVKFEIDDVYKDHTGVVCLIGGANACTFDEEAYENEREEE